MRCGYIATVGSVPGRLDTSLPSMSVNLRLRHLSGCEDNGHDRLNIWIEITFSMRSPEVNALHPSGRRGTSVDCSTPFCGSIPTITRKMIFFAERSGAYSKGHLITRRSLIVFSVNRSFWSESGAGTPAIIGLTQSAGSRQGSPTTKLS